MTIQKAFYYATIMAMFLISALIIGFTVMWNYPYKIMELNSIRVVNHPKPGLSVQQTIDMLVDVCKYKETDVNITYTVFYVQEVSEFNPTTNATESAYVSRKISESYVESSSGQAGCGSFIDPTPLLPPFSLPGKYEVELTFSFEINKFKDVQYRYKVDFTI